MRYYSHFLAACTVATLAGGAAYADCAQELAAFESGSEAQDGIAKDGTLAPLEGAADAGSTESAGAEGTEDSATDTDDGIAKDGTLAPLEGAADGQSDQAMSGQDVEAQQEGEPTAAETAADSGAGGTDRAAAIEKARAALAAGDEEACREALKEAGTM